MSLLETMRNAGVPPNSYTYNSAIHACARKVRLTLLTHVGQTDHDLDHLDHLDPSLTF